MALRKFLIPRSPRSGRLEGRAAADPVTRFAGFTALALILLLIVLPARAEDFGTTVAALAGASFADKEKGVVILGKSGEPRAVPILQALGGDRLRKASDGRVVIVDAGGGSAKLTDAATGQPIGDISPDS